MMTTTVSILSLSVFLLDILLDRRQELRIRSARRWLHAVHVIGPPGTARPPEPAGPDVGVLLQVGEHVLDGGDALGVGAAGRLAEDAALPVGLEPLGRLGHALAPDRPRHARLRRARPVRVQVLVHLVHELVRGVRQLHHVGCCAARDLFGVHVSQSVS